MLAIGVANRPAENIVGKDTAQNIRNTHEFVVNVVNEDVAEAMNFCAIDFPQGVDELKLAGVETEPSIVVSVPRISRAPAAMECREITSMEIGNSRIVLGQVVAMHVKDEFLDPAGPYIRAEQLHAIGRMNGRSAYIKTRDAFFHMPRVTYEEWEKKNGEVRPGDGK